MSGMERRKIACSVTFHVVAVTCVVWSLYVLIERTTVEVQVWRRYNARYQEVRTGLHVIYCSFITFTL